MMMMIIIKTNQQNVGLFSDSGVIRELTAWSAILLVHELSSNLCIK